MQFASVANFLKQAGQIDKATLVAYQGFTQDAFLAAQAAGIELISFADLESRFGGVHMMFQSPSRINYSRYGAIATIIKKAERAKLPKTFPETVFVLMPFSSELDDVYLYGIRGCVQKLGLKCRRADEIEHNHEILKEVIDNLKRAHLIIAEVTDSNPNVFYELGWAHALKREPILVAKAGTKLPFDIGHINTIFYKSIKDLEDQLTPRVKAGLG